MAVQSVAISVSGVPQTVTFDTVLQAYSATVPLQVADVYSVAVKAQDFGGNITTAIAFVSIAQGELVKVQTNDVHGIPVTGVAITAFYENQIDGTNYGRAEFQSTANDGSAYLHLAAGVYNIQISRAGFASQVVKNFQVFFGINTFIGTGGTLVESHSLKDNMGIAIPGAHVKLTQNDLVNSAALVAHQVTDIGGGWSIPLLSAKIYTFTFEKPGYDFEQVVIQSA